MNEFMGVPVKQKDGVAKVSRADFNKIKDSKGLTKEVRDLEAKFDEEVAREAVKILGQEVIKTKQPAKLELGTGDGKTTITVKAKTSAINPATKEPIDLYGVTSIAVKKVMPKALRDGDIADMRKKIEKAIG